MKRIAAFLTVALLLAGCSARQTDARTEALQERYAAMEGCGAHAAVTVLGEEDETLRYLLELTHSGDETRVAVREPEELADVIAGIRGERLELSFDGMVLDAGSVDPRVSALNCFDLFLHAAAEGSVTERSEEDLADTQDALRLCFETEQDGEKLLVTAYFDAEDRPLSAELERGGKILAYLEFTDFYFCDKITESKVS